MIDKPGTMREKDSVRLTFVEPTEIIRGLKVGDIGMIIKPSPKLPAIRVLDSNAKEKTWIAPYVEFPNGVITYLAWYQIEKVEK